MNIVGKQVLIRAIEETDLPLLHKWANDPEIWFLLGGWHFPGSLAETQAWFLHLPQDKLNQRFAIELGGQLIGTTNLVEIDWKNNHASHGMVLGDQATRGKGYGRDTVMALMRYAFEELHLERLDSTIIEHNQPSLNLYLKKCGWKEEGRQRNWYFRKNRYWDRIVIGVTRQDYAELIEQTGYWNQSN